MTNVTLETLPLKLFAIQAVKFGTFTLRGGLVSPIYIDLRRVISYPQLLKEIAAFVWEKAQHLSFSLVCGVPYAAIPLATCFSIAKDIPMVLRRQAGKEYGTKQLIEGVFKGGETCLILEDVITHGASIIETAEDLRAQGLEVHDAIIIVDRCQGGRELMKAKGIQAHCLLTLPDLLKTLFEAQKINGGTYKLVLDFLDSQKK